MRVEPLLEPVFGLAAYSEVEGRFASTYGSLPFTVDERKRIKWRLPVGGIFLLLTLLKDFELSEESTRIMSAFSAMLRIPAGSVRVGDYVVATRELSHVRSSGAVRVSWFASVSSSLVDSNRLLDAIVEFRLRLLSAFERERDFRKESGPTSSSRQCRLTRPVHVRSVLLGHFPPDMSDEDRWRDNKD